MKVNHELKPIPEEYRSPELDHLSDVQIYQLIERYYKNEDLEGLIEEYSLKGVRPTTLVTKLPPSIEDTLCPFCEINYITYRKPRSGGSKKPTHCPSCGHLELAGKRSLYCRCNSCHTQRKIKMEQDYEERKKRTEEQKRIEEEQKRQKQEEQKKLEEERKKQEQEKLEKHLEMIERVYGLSNFHKKKLSDLTFKDLWFLSSLLNVGYDQEKLLIKPVWSYQDELGPTQDFIVSMLEHLYRSNIILPYPKENVHSFAEDGFRILQVYFYINIEEFHDNTTETLEYLINPPLRNVLYVALDFELVYQCWRELVFEEVFQDLSHRLSKINQGIERDEKTYTVLKGLINHFTPAQLFHISHKQIANKNLWYTSNLGHLPDRFVEAVLEGMKRYGEYALTQDWDLYGFKTRHNELPATAVSEVFFNKLLFLGEESIQVCPTVNFVISQIEKLTDQLISEHQKEEKENEIREKISTLEQLTQENETEIENEQSSDYEGKEEIESLDQDETGKKEKESKSSKPFQAKNKNKKKKKKKKKKRK